MKPRTEVLLYHLLWSSDKLLRPTFRNLTDSFEGWAYRNGFLRQIQALEARRLVERQPGGGTAEAIYQLSEHGRLVALGGRDPVARWKRRWDGQWRMVLFDLPEVKASARVKLRRFLRDCGFGYLQNSVWITPDPLNSITTELSTLAADVESLVTLEARPALGETNADIVNGAWDFKRINGLYENCLKVFHQLPKERARKDAAAGKLQRWAHLERSTWKAAISVDPLLPDELLPAGYIGKKAWNERVDALAMASRLIRQPMERLDRDILPDKR
jgi:phenylacetic acid degradation operon negative regulatory protein